MVTMYRKIRHFLGSNRYSYLNPPFEYLNSSFEKLLFAVRFFYLCCFINSTQFIIGRAQSLSNQGLFEPQWILWIFPWPESKYIVIAGITVVGIVAPLVAVFRPWLRTARLFTFLSIFYFIGTLNSDGHYSHHMMMMMYPAFFLIFLPSNKGVISRRFKFHSLQAFFGAQLSVCLAYEMAGYSKITEIFRCLYERGFDECAVGSNIMANMAAAEKIQYGWSTFSGDFLYQFPAVGAFLYYLIIWLHLVSLAFAFRPHLHHLFLAYRISFHFGTLILFGISFTPNILAVVSVFAFSPFLIKISFLEQIKEIPPVRRVWP